VKTRAMLALLAIAIACAPDEPEVTGRWKNRTNQLLVIEKNLSGRLAQETRCANELRVKIHRDPYDAYAIIFEPNQAVYFPVEQKPLFAPNEFFCSSKDSTAMCRFCRIEDGDLLTCDSTEQKITGRGASATHDCNWIRVITATTSTTSAGCPEPPDAGMAGCRAVELVGPDGGVADGG
jgi:hypothetical protein